MLCRRIHVWVSLLLLISGIHHAWSQAVIPYSSADSIILLGNKAFYFEDTSNLLTLQQIRGDSIGQLFNSSKTSVPNFGNTASTYWCRFTLLNTTGQDLYLEFRKALFDNVEFYYQDSSREYTSILTGSAHPRKTRPVDDNYFIFALPASMEVQTYYLKVKSISNISFPLSLGSGRHMFAKHRDEEFIYGLYIGLILTLALYNLFILLAVRDRNYFYYIAYLLVNLILYDLSAIGFGAEYLWRDSISGSYYYLVTDILVGLAIVINLLFLSEFLDLKKNLPITNTLNQWVYRISALIVLINCFHVLDFIPFTQSLIIFSSLYTWFIILYAYYKKIKRVRFLLIGWTLYLFGIIFYELYILGFLPYHGIIVNAIPVGTCMEALFFSFALADRIRELRNEKLVAQQENLSLIKNQKELLEKTVHERTLEIATQNEEMVAQHEEMVTLQDQLSVQNDSLEKQNEELTKARKLIELQNDELRNYTENLKEEVKKKANDLIVSNQELVKHNHQLQQFSFITAHNLRSPVARILGLINLLNINTTDAEEKDFILEQIRITGQDLDQVIKDLAIILDIKKGISENYKAVFIKEKINRVQTLLKAELEKNNVTLLIDVSETETVLGLGAYVESILFNLISNAIKYRSPDRLPRIEVRARKENGWMKLSIRDNGLGINLDAQQHKIFGMYQRFHFHVEGRGLGLHLVKTQTESMGGKISIESELDKGTHFEIAFPAVH